MPRPKVRAVPVTTSAVVLAQPCAFHGATLRETGGTNPVTVRVFDNASGASGTVLLTRRLAANESFDVYFPVEDNEGGIRADNGLYVEVTGTGTLEGSIRLS